MVKKITQIVLAVVIVLLGYIIYLQISTPIAFDKDFEKREKAVIERIKDIRKAERAFKTKYQYFTASFDTLENFILNDFIQVEKKKYDENDSVGMAKLKKGEKNIEIMNLPVIEHLFGEKKMTKEEVAQMRYIPYSKDKEFSLDAKIIETESKVKIPVVECKASYRDFLDMENYRQLVINKIKDPALVTYDKFPGVMFGSLERGNNEAGNWED